MDAVIARRVEPSIEQRQLADHLCVHPILRQPIERDQGQYQEWIEAESGERQVHEIIERALKPVDAHAD